MPDYSIEPLTIEHDATRKKQITIKLPIALLNHLDEYRHNMLLQPSREQLINAVLKKVIGMPPEPARLLIVGTREDLVAYRKKYGPRAELRLIRDVEGLRIYDSAKWTLVLEHVEGMRELDEILRYAEVRGYVVDDPFTQPDAAEQASAADDLQGVLGVIGE